MASRPDPVTTVLSELPLVDHHVHGVVPGRLERNAFELLISEGGAPPIGGTSHFESPIGLNIRRACAPVLGLEPLASAEEYLERRAELGEEATDTLLRRSGLGRLLVDTGHRGGEVLTPEEMGRRAGAPAAEVGRLEVIAEDAAREASGPAEYLELLPTKLEEASARAVGWKTIVAYRYGFDLDVAPPSRPELLAALDEWFAGAGRLESPVLLRHLLHLVAGGIGKEALPLQIHTGFGDTDLELHRADPVVFTPYVRLFGKAGVPLVFLHCYPYHRQAGYLAHVFRHVYFDVGCILNYAGPGGRAILSEALELAPFTKMLYSSDAFGLAELVYLGAEVFRRHLSSILSAWVAGGECLAEDAEQIARLISIENAERLYKLEERANPARER